MIEREKEGIRWLEFEQLQEHPEVLHAVVLKPYDFSDPRTLEAIQRLFGLKSITRAIQIHGDQIERIPCGFTPECDGLMTESKGQGLIVTHADCQAVLFYDPVTRVIANIHCGWRGHVLNIYGKAVGRLGDIWGVKPENLLVCISPSLGPDAAEFVNHKVEFPSEFFPFQVTPNHFDLWSIGRMQLEAAGIYSHHIEIAKRCTYSEEVDFFSYRRDKKTGRHGTLIAKKV